MDKKQEIQRLRALALEIDDGMSPGQCRELHEMANKLEREVRADWVAELKEQHPAHAALIDRAASEAADEEGNDFGDYVLGCLQEEGVDV